MAIKRLRSTMLRKNARRRSMKSTFKSSSNNRREGDMTTGNMRRAEDTKAAMIKDMERKTAEAIRRDKTNSLMKVSKTNSYLRSSSNIPHWAVKDPDS